MCIEDYKTCIYVKTIIQFHCSLWGEWGEKSAKENNVENLAAQRLLGWELFCATSRSKGRRKLQYWATGSNEERKQCNETQNILCSSG